MVKCVCYTRVWAGIVRIVFLNETEIEESREWPGPLENTNNKLAREEGVKNLYYSLVKEL